MANDDWNDKKEGFIEVLKLMEMINKEKKSPWDEIARVMKNQLNAFMDAGFTREESFELVKSIMNNAGGLKNG